MYCEISRPVCILGLGLIGGSLLRDLKEAGHPVYGYNRSPSVVSKATGEGFDVSGDLEATLRRASEEDALIVMATPMPVIGKLLEAIAEFAPNCGFTDVVSVKAEVLALVKAAGLEDNYVGSHPMAGTAESGWSAAQTGLFRGAAWVVTFDRAEQGEVPGDWLRLWVDVVHLANRVGAEVIPSRVAQHDAAAARVSHLPHILAEALAIVGDNGGALALSLAASSFRDGTRVAATSPSLVRAMCETNHTALLDAVDECIAILQDARAHLADSKPNLEELCDAGYRSRIRYEARSGTSAAKAFAKAQFASAVPPMSARPVLRIHLAAGDLVSQLIQAENVGARIEVV
ncbi:MAG: prephenate dehydrogenase [Corynebacterium sp.]|nr:prephenate dehydrogenase [Corynebacterium sp.]